MKKLLTTITLCTLVGTSASDLQPIFTNTAVNHGFNSNQIKNKEITIQGENSGNPFINKIKTIDIDANISSSVISFNGTIYVGTYNHGLYKSTDGILFQSVKGVPIDVASVTTLGKIVYIGTQKNGLWKSDDGINFDHIKQFDGLYISTVAISSDGTIYVEDLGDLYKSTDGINFDHIKQFDGAIYSININKGNIWIGTTKGLYKSNNGTDFENITNGISKDVNIRVVKFDIKNIIWVGTKQGLYKSIDGIKFESVDLKTENNNEIRSIATNSKLVLLGLDNGIIYKSVDGINFEKIKQMDAYIQVNVTLDGTIYIGTEKNGLWIINSLIKINDFNYFGDKYDGSVYNSVQKIDIKDKLVETATLDNKNITLPATDLDITVGEHVLILTLKDKSLASDFGGDTNTGKVIYKLWVKTTIDKEKINYSTNIDDTDLLSGLVSDLGNTNNAQIIQTRVKQGSSVHPATLSSNFDDILIDYKNSFYIQGTVNETTNDFTESGSKQKLSKTTQIITDGIYHLHLVDTVSNTYDSYLELGESNWKLQGKFDDGALNDKANKLNVTVDSHSASQEVKQEAMGWLQKYQSIADSKFGNTVLTKGKGFSITINDLSNGYKEFLEPVTYVNPQTQYPINQNKLDDVVTKIAEQKLQDGLSVLPQNLNVDTKNVVNKSTLDSYTSWINAYNDFINNHKDQWINDVVSVASRGFATTDQENQIKNHIASLDFKNYLQHVLWTANTNLSTSNDYQQFVELDKLQSDTIDWVNQNIPDINQAYQNAITQAESGLDLHGYTISEILNGKQKPQTKNKIDNFADGQSYHDWLQSQANIKFHGWQLKIGLPIGLISLIIAVVAGVFIRRRTNPKYNPFRWERKKEKQHSKMSKSINSSKNKKRKNNDK